MAVIAQPLLQHCEQEAEKMIRTPQVNEFFAEVVLNCTGNQCSKIHHEGNKSGIYNKLVQLASSQADDNIMNDAGSGRALARLIKQSEGKVESLVIFKDTTLATQLAENLKDKQKLAQKKGPSFVILTLLETESVGSKIREELLPHVKTLSSCKETTCVIIVKKLTEAKQD